MSVESFRGKKILVTGGGGYFGHKLGNALRKKGAAVLAFDISWPLDTTAYKQLECVQVRYGRSLSGVTQGYVRIDLCTYQC